MIFEKIAPACRVIAACALLGVLGPCVARAQDSKPHLSSERTNGDCTITMPLQRIVSACSEVLQRDPANFEAYGLRGNAYRRMGKWELADKDLDQAIALKPEHLFAYSRRLSMNTIRMKGYLVRDDAVLLQNSVAQGVSDLEARASKHMDTKDRTVALELLNAGLTLDPTHPTLRLGRASAYLGSGKLKDAVKDAELVVSQYPDYAFARQVLGIVFSIAREFGPAQAAFDEAIRLDPLDVRSFVERGMLRFELGRLVEAHEDLTQAIKLAPNHPGAFAVRGVINAERSNGAGALEDFDTMFSLMPPETNLRLLHQTLFIIVAFGAETDGGHPMPAALRALQAKVVSAYQERAASRISLGRFAEAVADASRAIDLAQGPVPKLHGDRAKAYLRLNRLHEALADADKAIAQSSPPPPQLFLLRSEIQQVLGNPEKAREDSDRAKALEAQQPTVSAGTAAPAAPPPKPTPPVAETLRMAQLGAAIQKVAGGQYTLALVELDKLISENANFAPAYATRALAYAGAKDYSRAMADADKAMALEPRAPFAIRARCGVFAAFQLYTSALMDCDRLVAIEGPNANNLALRGRVHLLLRTYDKAIGDLDNAVRLDGKTQHYRLTRGIAYLFGKRSDDALHDFRTVLEVEPGNAFAIGLLALLSTPVQKEERMEVKISRLADPACGDACPEWISAQGYIVSGTAASFRAIVKGLGPKKLPVFIHSSGGLLNES